MIRPYRDADAEATWSVYRDAVRDVAPHYTPAQGRAWCPDDAMDPAWRARLADDDAWIAVAEARAVGFIALAGKRHLDLFFVLGEARGTRVAPALYDALVAEARAAGTERLTAYASLFLKPFLERRGWVVTEVQDNARGGETLRRFAMASPPL